MKVKKLQKMYFKKTVIAKMNAIDIEKVKGGTSSFDPPTGLDTHCGEYVCF
jgi:hypothetical protein